MKHPKKSFLFLTILLVACFLMNGKTFAQTTLVTLEGTVNDEEGAFLPGVAVTVKNVETGYTKSTVTRTDGSYRISGIQPGKYECEVSLQGITLTVSLKGENTLVASIPGQGEIELVPYKGTEFNMKNLAGFSIEFIVDESGTMTEAKVTQPNGVFTAEKK